MSYDHELDAWRDDVHRMTEAERDVNRDSHRAALGVVGDISDVGHGGDY